MSSTAQQQAQKTDGLSSPPDEKTDGTDVRFSSASKTSENGRADTASRPSFSHRDFLRAVDGNPLVTGGPLDLVRVMCVWSDEYGRCDLTRRQIQERLVSRQADGSYVPVPTIRDWRAKLKRLGVIIDVKPGAGPGFGGPGRGNGGTWQLLENRWDWERESGEGEAEAVPSVVKTVSRSTKKL